MRRDPRRFGGPEVVRVCLAPQQPDPEHDGPLREWLAAHPELRPDAAELARQRARMAEWRTGWIAAAALGGFLCLGYGPEHDAHAAADAEADR